MNYTIEINTDLIIKHLEHPLQEGPSDIGFLIGIYLEHLEEASFLYEQRISLLDDPELSWRDLNDFEERFEAHIDALVVGEELALATCMQQVIEGDFGELHAAIRVVCRWNNFTLFKYIIDNSDIEDEKRLKAIDDALCHEMPDEWAEDVHTLFTQKDALALFAIFAHVLGYKRISRNDIIHELIDKNSDSVVIAQCAWALGRIGSSKNKNRLLKLFQEQTDETIREQAGLALLRLKDTTIIGHLIDIKEPWAYILLGMSGTSKAKDALVSMVSNQKRRCPESLLGIGLIGAVQAIDNLIDALGEEKLSEASSLALYCITGAELFKEIEIDEEQVTAEDEEQIEDGLPPEKKNTIFQLSQNSEVWKEWLEENRESLSECTSLLLGNERNYSNVKRSLTSEKPPKNIRRYLCEMGAVLSHDAFDLEYDWRVKRQDIFLS